MKIEIKNRYNGNVIISGKYESIKDCLEKNKDADLRGANLGGAYLGGANLRGADLRGAKNYSENHDFFQELVRREKVDNFTETQWSYIGQIVIHRLCWDSIKKRFGKKILPVFKVLAKSGFDEYLKRYLEILKD